jgi:hypothetical protein
MPLWHQLMNQKPLFSISENYSQHCQTTLSWSKYYSLVSIGVNRSEDCLAQNQNNVSKWSDMSTLELLLNSDYSNIISTIEHKKYRDHVLDWNKHKSVAGSNVYFQVIKESNLLEFKMTRFISE